MTATVNSEAGFFSALMDAAIDAIIIIDREARIRRFNHSAERLFGYREAEVLNRNVRLLMGEPDRGRHDSYIERYLDGGKPTIIGSGREVTGLRKNGEQFPMRLSVGRSGSGENIHFVGIAHDLTERRSHLEKLKNLELQLFHADRLLTLGELTAGIAHEMNQPLTAIAAYADALVHLVDQQMTTGDSGVKSICSRISEQSRRAAAVVDRLRKLVRSGTSSKARLDIKSVVNNMLLLFEYELKKAGVLLEVSAPDDAVMVFIDEIQVQQILVNLVKNSLDSIIESGRQDGRIDIVIMASQDELAISVLDNGSGVAEESLPHLFEPFYTSKAKGVGLGLSICKHIAEAHGGMLAHVPTTTGQTCFTLRLPRSSIG